MYLKNIKEIKNTLRAKHKRIRTSCPPEIKQKLDTKLYENFIVTDEYKNSKTVFAFVSSNIEVNTYDILNKVLSDGKRLALPKCRNKRGEMDFYYVTSLSQLLEGAFSIMEPSSEICEKVTDFSQGLCIVPGLCFDFYGYRIGFGKGYYDRFLQGFKGVTVGLCYSKCIEKELPAGNYDKPVDIIITEKFTTYTHSVKS